MDHVAILRKARISKGVNLLKDIADGTKTVESRWYVNKVSPWGKINVGDTVYFKESGGFITIKAKVFDYKQFENLNLSIVNEIINRYGSQISPNTSKESWRIWAKTQMSKKYCILVFLEDVVKIPPFAINKEGFGISSAWLVMEDINKIKCRNL